MDALTHLFALSDAYRALTGLAESTISKNVLKNGHRLRDLRAKSTDIGVYRVETAIRWFDEHWPEGGSWPADVPRPSQSPPTAQAAAQAPEAA